MPELDSIERDDQGFLLDPEAWSESLARELASEEDITLEDEHWFFIDYIREVYAEQAITPDIRHALTAYARQFGIDKKAARKRFFELFPYGYVKQTCKIAGMRRPRAWSTG